MEFVGAVCGELWFGGVECSIDFPNFPISVPLRRLLKFEPKLPSACPVLVDRTRDLFFQNFITHVN
jgi:hypothetical protein